MLNIKSLKNSKTLKASSIIESIIAIVLISVCSLVTFTIYLNVITQNNAVHYYEAKHRIETINFNATINQDFENETFKYLNYSIDKKVSVDDEKYMAIITYTVTTSNKIKTFKKLVPIKVEN